MWEHATPLADNQSDKDATNFYWNDVYRVQQEEVVMQAKEKKERKPRKDKGLKRNTKKAEQNNINTVSIEAINGSDALDN